VRQRRGGLERHHHNRRPDHRRRAGRPVCRVRARPVRHALPPIDILDKPGGQCAELYPEKPIYDIPGYPVISAQGLVDKLMEQIAPFKPDLHLQPDGDCAGAAREWQLPRHHRRGEVFDAKVVVIAAGGGSFQPKRPPIPGIEAYEGGSASSIRCAAWRISAIRRW
jgi:thioredoxin reductase (NADPH)